MASEKIAIITDSTNDLPMELREKYQIAVVPLTIVWGDKQYLDGVDMPAKEFYERLKLDPIHPTTSQPTPGDFLTAYEAARAGGARDIVVCTISGAMSGTIESARLAAQSFSMPVTILGFKKQFDEPGMAGIGDGSCTGEGRRNRGNETNRCHGSGTSSFPYCAGYAGLLDPRRAHRQRGTYDRQYVEDQASDQGQSPNGEC